MSIFRNTGSNSSTAPYKCHVCNAVFARPDVLGNHLNVVHSETVYKCEICEATFGDVRGKNHHMYNEHQLDAFHQKCVWCPVCNQGFTRQYNLKVHMYKSHGKDYIENNFSPGELAALMKQPATAGPAPGLTGNPAAAAAVIPALPVLPQVPLSMAAAGLLPVTSLPTKPVMTAISGLTPHHPGMNPVGGVAKTLKAIRKRPRIGPASKINAPPEKRVKKVAKKEGETGSAGGGLTSIIKTLAAQAATKKTSGGDQKQPCNFCDKICRNQLELTQHLVEIHFKGLLGKTPAQEHPHKCTSCPKTFPTAEGLESHVKNFHRIKALRRSLGLDEGPEYRRPGPKRARLSYHANYLGLKNNSNPEGTPFSLKRKLKIASLPSTAVLSASKLVAAFCSNHVSMSKRSLAKVKSLKPVLITQSPQPSAASLSKSSTSKSVQNIVSASSNSVLSKAVAAAFNIVNKSPGSTITLTPTEPPKQLIKLPSVNNRTMVAGNDSNNNNNNNNNNSISLNPEENGTASDGSPIFDINPFLNKPRKKSECPVCGIVLSPKTNVNVHLRTHSGVRPYECVLCLNRFRQKAHLMKHFRCSHNQKQPPHICLFCPLETTTSNDLYRHIADAHQKETDELRPSLLAARSDAQQAAKEQAERQEEQDKLQQTAKQIIHNQQQVNIVIFSDIHFRFLSLSMSFQVPDSPEAEEEEDEEEDVRYEPITEDIEFEDQTISPCYVVLPFVSDEECNAARNPPPENVSKCFLFVVLVVLLNAFDLQDLFDNEDDIAEPEVDPDDNIAAEDEEDESPLTIDESITEEETNDISNHHNQNAIISANSPLKMASSLGLTPRKEYNAEDINEENSSGGFYPAISDFSLPISMANIWKKKADELGPMAMQSLTLMEKIKQMEKYNGSLVYTPPSPPPPERRSRTRTNHQVASSPPSQQTNSTPRSGSNPSMSMTATPVTPKSERKSITSKSVSGGGNNDTTVTDYESQIKNDIWPLDCIKCNTLLGNLDNFNIHMNDHWSENKCCPVCGLLINRVNTIEKMSLVLFLHAFSFNISQ